VATGYQAVDDAAAANCDLGIGDPVRKVSTGYFEMALDGETIWGIVVGIEQYYDGTRILAGGLGGKVPGGTAYGTVLDRETRILILPVADIWWSVHVDDKTTATTYAAYIALLGEECDHFSTVSGGRANPKIDISGHGTGTAGWQLIDVQDRNQDFSGSNVRVVVECTEPQLDGV
jgi:hypothetical protein